MLFFNIQQTLKVYKILGAHNNFNLHTRKQLIFVYWYIYQRQSICESLERDFIGGRGISIGDILFLKNEHFAPYSLIRLHKPMAHFEAKKWIFGRPGVCVALSSAILKSLFYKRIVCFLLLNLFNFGFVTSPFSSL